MAIDNHTSNPSLATTPKNYVIYALIDPRNGILFYVGITRNIKKRLQSHICNRNPKDTEIKRAYFDSLKASHTLPVVNVLDEIELLTPLYAFHIESAWIRLMDLRLGTLINGRVNPEIKTEEEALQLIEHYKTLDAKASHKPSGKIQLTY